MRLPLAFPRAARRALIAVATGVALVAGPLAAAPAHATPVVLSGTVTGQSGQALAGIYAVAEDEHRNVEAVETDAQGRYAITLPEGTYKLRFQDLSNTYATEYWPDQVTYEEGETIVLGPSGRSGVDATLGLNSTISGTVTARIGGAPVSGVTVYSAVDDGEGGWYLASEARTDDDGTYELYVPNGRGYRISFEHDSYATQFYNDRNGDQVPDLVVMSSAHRGGIDAALDERSAIGGTVTSAGSPLSAVEVSAYGLRNGVWTVLASDSTGTDGRYVIDVDPGNYRLGFTKNGYDASYWSDKVSIADAATITVGAAAVTGRNTVLYRTPEPTITGTAQVGRTLTAVPGTWRGSTTLSYQWRRGGTDIPGARSSTYVVGPDDAGTTLRVAVTGTSSDRPARTIESSATGTVIVGSLTSTVPTISGSATIGSTLTVTKGAWGPDGVGLGVQWYRGTEPIEDAHDDTYTVTNEDGSSRLSVHVTGSKPGYETVTRESAPTTAVPPAANAISFTAAPAITGAPKVGVTLTASRGTWNPADVEVAYQWRRAGTDIAGATSSTYVPTTADVGRTLTVVATGSKAGMIPASATSVATSQVVAADAPTPVIANVAPSITGTAKVGSTLTASPGSWSASDVTFTYQWRRAGVDIAGATQATYTPTATDVGATLYVRVRGTKSGMTSTVADSAATGVVTAATPPPAPSPPAKKAAIMIATAKVKKRKPTFSIAVAAAGRPATGLVAVRVNGKTSKLVTLRAGRATITLPKQKKGTRVYTVLYGGDSRVLKRSINVKVKIK